MSKKTISLILVLCMMISCVLSVGFTASAESVEPAPTGDVDYGLADSCEDGNILHCFNWTLNQIKDELPNIAAAGFTSVQTSPLQAHNGSNQWYWLYQPKGFSIGNELGSYSDLQNLCTAADQYGIKIIVDVVANHLAGNNSGTWSTNLDSNLKKTEYFHNLGACNDWDNRYDITQKNIGMPDLNSENAELRSYIVSMVSQLRSAGVDGIRWDAAKHIALPSEGCDFWSEMAEEFDDMYLYGEVLGNPAGDSGDTVNKALINEYAEYVGVTDSQYSSDIVNAIRNGTIYKTAGYWSKRGVDASKLVYWGESHDTYSNDGDEAWTKNLDQNLIDRGYAILGARAGAQALYFSRPSEKAKTSIYYAKKGSTHFTSNEVAAVNHFHNAMIGTDEAYSTTGNCYVVWREGGAVIVPMSGGDVDVSVSNRNKMVPVGTYVDEVSGNSFTVTETTITGHVGSSGIAVIYNGESPVTEFVLGDADGNGDVESPDVTYIMRWQASIQVPIDETTLMNGDVDQNGDLEIVDATYIQRYLALFSVPYAIGETLQR